METALNHMASGTVAGMIAVTFDYPLDVLKTRMQVYGGSLYSSYWNCACRIVRREGIFAFYKGLPVPLMAQGLENAVLFTTYNTALHHLSKKSEQQHPVTCTPALRSWQKWTAAAITGMVVSLILTPVEYVKCNMQVHNMLPCSVMQHGNSFAFAQATWRRQGLRGFYCGFTGTVARAVPGNIAYFMTYEQMREWLGVPSWQVSGDSGTLPLWKSMLAGGCSGCAYWTIFFPADVVKTRMQVDSRVSRMGFLRAFGHVYKESGVVRGLYRGWGLTALRSFPSCGVVFTMYEWCSSRLRSYRKESPPHRPQLKQGRIAPAVDRCKVDAYMWNA